MQLNTKEIQLQYEGFIKTPLLWENSEISTLNQFECELNTIPIFNTSDNLEIRLGKRVEQFAIFSFLTKKNNKLIAQNIQIQHKKQTVGEIDCLLIKNNKPVHIEIVYKFYLYHQTNKNLEIYNWIGPNKKDNLFQKVTKLKEKQLPLLHNQFTTPYLDSLNLHADEMNQKVYFKAQLFVPLNKLNYHFKLVNNNCIEGFYITLNELNQFQNGKFFIPTKLNWLQKPRTDVTWISFLKFKSAVQKIIDEKTSPLCWLKYPNGLIHKFFLIWWN